MPKPEPFPLCWGLRLFQVSLLPLLRPGDNEESTSTTHPNHPAPSTICSSSRSAEKHKGTTRGRVQLSPGSSCTWTREGSPRHWVRIAPTLTSSHKRRSWTLWLPRDAEWAGQVFLLSLSFGEVERGFELLSLLTFQTQSPLREAMNYDRGGQVWRGMGVCQGVGNRLVWAWIGPMSAASLLLAGHCRCS